MLTPKEQILQTIKKGKITGSWLISGSYGVGKKTFARKLAAFLLTGDWEANVENHPNLKWIEHSLTEDAKKEIQKMILAGKSVEENAKTTAKKKEITVDDIRNGLKFLSLKAGENEYRILIVSPADDMNPNAANALLKVLEEPYPRSILLLISQNSGKLLPTIRSRCRQITIPNMGFEEELAELKKIIPDCKAPELLTELSAGSIGLALKIHELNGLNIYQKMNTFFVPFHRLDIAALNEFVTTIDDDDTFFIFSLFLFGWLNKQAKSYLSINPLLAEKFVDIYEETNKLFQTTAHLYLDRKQAVINTFLSISEALS